MGALHSTMAQRAERLRRLREDRPAELRDALEALDHRSRRVLEWRYGLDGEQPRKLGDVAREFYLTRERIRQIEVKAFEQVVTRVEAIVRSARRCRGACSTLSDASLSSRG